MPALINVLAVSHPPLVWDQVLAFIITYCSFPIAKLLTLAEMFTCLSSKLNLSIIPVCIMYTMYMCVLIVAIATVRIHFWSHPGVIFQISISIGVNLKY